ncbi:MAG TPA: hypothetical protein VGV93_07185, partial [Acidimicrobiales bacterium]|nr:hypothetical protein [Acidimicrobiales bacterium]
VRGPDVAVTADGFVAYPTGVEFHMTVRTRQPDYELDPFFRRPLSRHGGAPSDVLRLGFQFSDGSKATYGGFRPFRSSDDGTPDGPVLSLGRGGGGGRTWRAALWLWPLPPEGPLALVVECGPRGRCPRHGWPCQPIHSGWPQRRPPCCGRTTGLRRRPRPCLLRAVTMATKPCEVGRMATVNPGADEAA